MGSSPISSLSDHGAENLKKLVRILLIFPNQQLQGEASFRNNYAPSLEQGRFAAFSSERQATTGMPVVGISNSIFSLSRRICLSVATTGLVNLRGCERGRQHSGLDRGVSSVE